MRVVGIVTVLGALGLASWGCSMPTAIGKVAAQPTENFPEPWGKPSTSVAAVMGSTNESPVAGANKKTPKVPKALRPRDGAVARPSAVALVIGIDEYRAGVPRATGAERDAKLFADYAERTLGLSRGNIRLLTATDATRSSIDAVLDEWLGKNVDAKSELFFFFAGHGAPETESGRGYLVPWDADPKYIKSQGIAMDDLMARLTKAGAKHTYAFVDACFSGAGGRSVLAEGTRPLVRVKGHVAPTTTITMLTASGPEETTGATKSGHGLFSHHLLMGLNGGADSDRDGAITVNELATYTREKVRDDAARDNREQTPELVGSRGDEVLTRLPPRRD